MAAPRKVIASVSGPTGDVAFRAEAALSEGADPFAAARAALREVHDAAMAHFAALTEADADGAGGMAVEPTLDDGDDGGGDDGMGDAPPIGLDDPPLRKARTEGRDDDDGDE